MICWARKGLLSKSSSKEFKLKHLFFVSLLGLLFSNQLFAQSDLRTADINALKGSAWEGTFEAIGLTGGVRIAFLPNTSPKGDLQYFHKIQSSEKILKAIAAVDKACPITPRDLELRPSENQQSLVGTISVFPCATNQLEELELENSPNRKVSAAVVVNDFKLSNDGNSLQIIATIIGLKVTYQMERKPLSANLLSSWEALRSWVENLPANH